MRGNFIFYPDTDHEIVVPNNVLAQGEETFLKQICRADVTDVTSGGNYYIGLMGLTYLQTSTLSDIAAGEPVGNGYARVAMTRDASGWPILEQLNGLWRARTAIATFAASGSNFSVPISRAFLCNVGSGTSGLLFSCSAPLPTALPIIVGTPLTLRYELWLR